MASQPVLLLILAMAIFGAVLDHRYKKQGGMRPTRTDWIYFLVACALCLALLVGLGLAGGSAEGLGSASAVFTVVLFALWEFGRWRTRRKHPLPKSQA